MRSCVKIRFSVVVSSSRRRASWSRIEARSKLRRSASDNGAVVTEGAVHESQQGRKQLGDNVRLLVHCCTYSWALFEVQKMPFTM